MQPVLYKSEIKNGCNKQSRNLQQLERWGSLALVHLLGKRFARHVLSCALCRLTLAKSQSMDFRVNNALGDSRHQSSW